MSQAVAEKPSVAVTCQHYWIIEPEPGDGGGYLRAECQGCRRVTYFEGQRIILRKLDNVRRTRYPQYIETY